MKYCHVLTAIAIMAIATAAAAEDVTHMESGLSFKLPKGWVCAENGERITITNADKSVSCVGGVIPAEAAKAIFADIEAFLDKLDGLDDVDVTDGPQREKVNGLEQAWYEGKATAKIEGKTQEVQWDMTIVTGGKAILFLVGIGKLDENEKDYEALFESIRKANNE
jgi:predicted Zn-dependent protease